MPFFEKILVNFTQNKDYNSLFVRLLPSNNSYKTPTFRNAVRHGLSYKLDISDYMDYTIYFGIKAEPRDKLYGLVKEDFTVLDIGTNIGETLLGFAKITNGKSKIYGFEPVRYLYERCLENISLNRFKNVEVFNIALSDRDETLSFTPSPNQNSGGITMRKKTETGYVGTQVQATLLDSFLSKNAVQRVDLIKIDVEGFEYNVLGTVLK